MSRLIKDTDLLDELQNWKLLLHPEREPLDKIINDVLNGVEDIINNSNTAYDVRAVVQELYNVSYDNTDWGYSTYPALAGHYLMRAGDVIRIVERGGRNGN